MYTYQATVVNVVDGDTVDLDIDLGLHITKRERIRAKGINAPRLGTAAGHAAKGAAQAFLPNGTVIVVRTYLDKTEKYGRLLATMDCPVAGPVKDFAQLMVAAGHAVVWDGSGPRPADD